MALPTSGPLSINDIRVALGASSTNQSLGAFSDTVGLVAPDAISDFYGFQLGNLLEVISTSSGFPPNPVIVIFNRSVLSQTITYTWQYVSQSNPGVDPDATVQYGGTTRAVGYTTPTITTSLSGDNYAFTSPFFMSGGNGVTLIFKFVLLTAASDTVPSSPDNAGSVSYCLNCV